MNDIDGVVFDVGNTLMGIDHARVLRLLARHGVATPPLDVARRAEARARLRISDLLATGASTEDPLTFRRWVAWALEDAGFPIDERSLVAAFEDVCREHRERNIFSEVFPGAREALARLAAAGLTLAVVSNSNGRVAAKLREVELDAHLATIVDSGIVRIEKPDPRIFRIACERAPLDPARAIYVGDLHAVDVVGARAAGLTPVLVDPFGAWRERGVDVETVRDVAELADRLLGRG
jgi:putative hydrolase of the HAD superfamily